MEKTLNRQAGIQEITQLMMNVNFAGSNSKEEYNELFINMQSILMSKRYSYADIENYFIGWGYQVPMIREIFKNLTGLDPVRLNSSDYLADAPGCIPGFTYGWGEGKGKQYKFVFIITYKQGYGIFGQIDDLKRELIDYVIDLDEAFIVLNKSAKNIKTCRNVIDVNPETVMNRSELPFSKTNEPVTQGVMWKGKTASLVNTINEQISYMQPHEVKAMIRIAYDNSEITAQEHAQLLNYYIQRHAAEDGASTISEESSDLDALLSSQDVHSTKVETPEDAITKATQDNNVENQLNGIQNAVGSIKDYLRNNLTDFIDKGTIEVTALNYSKKGDGQHPIEKTPEVAGHNPKQYFNKVGFYTVILSITLDEKSDLGAQEVLTVFNINDNGKAETNGKFKGMDKNIYAFNYGGISEYFNTLANTEQE